MLAGTSPTSGWFPNEHILNPPFIVVSSHVSYSFPMIFPWTAPFFGFFRGFPSHVRRVFEEKLDQVHAWILSSILGQHNCPRWAPPKGGPGGRKQKNHGDFTNFLPFWTSEVKMAISNRWIVCVCIKIGYLRVPNGTKHVKPDFLMAKVSGMSCRFRTGVWLSKLEMLQYHMGWKQKRNLQRARFSSWWLVLQFWLT